MREKNVFYVAFVAVVHNENKAERRRRMKEQVFPNARLPCCEPIQTT